MFLQAVQPVALIGLLSLTIYTPAVSAQTQPSASITANVADVRPLSGTSAAPSTSVQTAPATYAEAQRDPSSDAPSGQTRTLPNLSAQQAWPPPVNDRENRLFTLVDVLEYRPRQGGTGSNSDYRWDIEGWYGGDYNRVWFKSEGQRDTAFKANYDVDFQLLYGRFLKKYYDFQIGPRVETQSFRGRNVTRALAAIGIEGLIPYSYELEATLFLDQDGAASARLSLTKDLFLTQRLILQARFQTNAAIQRVEEFTTGSGLNNLEFGVRLRYEIRREVAPYVGVSLDRSFGETATLVRQEGGSFSQLRFVAGLRMWF
jgi:copper resistance protein B